MISKTEAERLAAMAHAMRPDWPIPSLLTFLATQRTRAYRDLAVALAWVATDPATHTPARLNENGPWWRATQAQDGTFTAPAMRCTDHPAEPAGRCRPCELAASEGVDHQALAAAARQAARDAKAASQAEARATRDKYAELKAARA